MAHKQTDVVTRQAKRGERRLTNGAATDSIQEQEGKFKGFGG